MSAMACADCWRKWVPQPPEIRYYYRLSNGKWFSSNLPLNNIVWTIRCDGLPYDRCPACGSERVGEVEERPRLDQPMLKWHKREKRWVSVYRRGEERLEATGAEAG